ncbi:MAG TPA: dihydrolipoamide acetyltransferase family protein [Candidatus Binataceae bacterium]|nr:dihydrolipoamide acetyltransferase family protein [Candidatus Binataceae bacterium]
MAVEVTMPKFGLTMHEGTIQRYFKAIGESVSAGDPLYEVETEKVLYEVESPASGVFAAALFEEGATVECGVAVAVIAEAGDDPASIRAKYATAVASASASNGEVKIVKASASASVEAKATSGERRAVSPVARKLAAELGVNLDTVSGTGPGGRVTREDVERAAKTPAPAPGAKPAAAPQAAAMRGMRKTIAERMHRSLRDTAQLTITSEADVTAATELRERLKREFDFTYTDLLIQAAGRALLKHPRMNARLDGDQIVTSSDANIGIAVSLDDGLIVPVIRDVTHKSLREIAALSKDAGEKARAGKLKLEDITGGTFTITNLGTYGIDAFTPILNTGETGILGVGRIVEKPAIYRGEVTRRAMMTLSLTFDHRVIDGAPAAQFLQTVIDLFNFGER